MHARLGADVSHQAPQIPGPFLAHRRGEAAFGGEDTVVVVVFFFFFQIFCGRALFCALLGVKDLFFFGRDLGVSVVSVLFFSVVVWLGLAVLCVCRFCSASATFLAQFVRSATPTLL